MKYSLILWTVWYAYWIVSARKRLRDTGEARTRRESGTGRAVYLSLILAGFVVIFIARPVLGPDRQLWGSGGRLITGLAVQAVGLGFAIWARATLGKNWSGRITIGGSQELIVRGPYRVVRHPIYSGLMMAILGTALVTGWLHSLAGALLAFAGIWMKIRREETALRQHFGTAYEEYARRVGGLVPSWP